MRASKLIALLPVMLLSSIELTSAAQAATTLPTGYQNLDGCSKQAVLWNDHLATAPYATLPDVTGSWTTLLSNVNSLLFLNKTFDHNSDLMPEGRQKVVHSHGSAAAIELINNADSPFTGIFAPGTVCGITRISLAGSPDSLGFTPGMGIKLFVKGQPSLNFHVMNSVNGQGDDWNIFAKTFTNHLAAAQGFVLKSLAFAVSLTGHDLTHLPLDSQVSLLRTDGTFENDPVEPEQIAFVPVEPTRFEGTSKDFRLQLGSLPAGTAIYRVYGYLNGEWIEFGQMKTVSKFVASRFADEQLFFRHAE